MIALREMTVGSGAQPPLGSRSGVRYAWRSQELIGPWPPDWRQTFQMALRSTRLPPPKPSLKLIADRGPLKKTFEEIVVSAAFAWKYLRGTQIVNPTSM